MQTVEIVPSASLLIHSLRGLGYSPETAIADLLDNSITAGANAIEIQIDWNDGLPRVAVLDDGRGMDEGALIKAMCFGGMERTETRDQGDLGRFGLGLKTASLSQCRRMTVITRQEGNSMALCWDVDEVIQKSGWQALVVDPLPDFSSVRRLLDRPHGTLVIWDRIDSAGGLFGLDRETFFLRVSDIRRHLEMIFHRFLGGDARRIDVSVNGRSVRPWEPFQRAHPATITLHEERIRYGGAIVRVAPYVLPHRDRFANESESEEAGGVGGWSERQGFYVYRQKRLLVPGGWLGLGGVRAWTRDESSRLARIAIDLPTELDGDWRIDVRKSQARPPGPMRSRLTQIAAACREKAREVFAWRGQRARSQTMRSDYQPVWLGAARGSSLRYQVNRDHASVSAVLRQLGQDAILLDAMLALIERTVPVERIWLDVSESEGAKTPELTEHEVAVLAGQLAAIAQMLPSAIPASERADQLIRHLPGDTIKLREALLNLLEMPT